MGMHICNGTLLYMISLYLHVSELFTVESKKRNHPSTIIYFKLLMMIFYDLHMKKLYIT